MYVHVCICKYMRIVRVKRAKLRGETRIVQQTREKVQQYTSSEVMCAAAFRCASEFSTLRLKFFFSLIQLMNNTLYQAQFSSIIDACDEDQMDMLLNYNNTSLLYDLRFKDLENSVKLFWNSTPTDVVYVFPFIMAFTTDAIEIRLAVNGSLLATLYMPNLQLLSAKVLHWYCKHYRTVPVKPQNLGSSSSMNRFPLKHLCKTEERLLLDTDIEQVG